MIHHLVRTARLTRTARDLARKDDGVAAVEFALLAPVLISSLLLMADIALAVSQRMEMDSVLRTAAQLSMADPGLNPVQQALDALTTGAPYEATAQLYCECSGSACTELCSGGADHVAYMLKVDGPYESLFTPVSLDLSSRLEVRVK